MRDRERLPLAWRYAKPDEGADPALSIIYALGMFPIQLNVKHHGQEAAQSGFILIKFELIVLLRLGQIG